MPIRKIENFDAYNGNIGSAMATISKYPCFNVVHLAVVTPNTDEIDTDSFLITNRELYDLVNMVYNKSFLFHFGDFY